MSVKELSELGKTGHLLSCYQCAYDIFSRELRCSLLFIKKYISLTGALLKAAFICAEIVQYPSETRLEQQLMERYKGGFELETWSNLPHGSGMTFS